VPGRRRGDPDRRPRAGAGGTADRARDGAGDPGRAPAPEQVRAYRIADNKLTEIAGWDEKLLAEELQALNLDDVALEGLGFTDAELDELLAFDPDSEEGREPGTSPLVVPEPPRNPVARPGDLWLLGGHRLLCGDATRAEDVCRLMNGARATLFASDPPYLVDYDGSNHPTRNKIP